MMDENKHFLDLRGDVCPLPVLKTRKKIEQIPKGDFLEVMVDYPVAKENILRTVHQMGEEVVNVKKEGHIFYILIKKTK